MGSDENAGLAAGSVILSLPLVITGTVLGGLHLDDCPIQPNIPVFLLVANSAVLFFYVFLIIVGCCWAANIECAEGVAIVGGVLVGVFLLAWHIAGLVWLYGVRWEYQSDYPHRADYCDEVLYMYTFSMEAIFLFFLILGGVVGCLLCCCGCCVAASNVIDVV